MSHFTQSFFKEESVIKKYSNPVSLSYPAKRFLTIKEVSVSLIDPWLISGI